MPMMYAFVHGTVTFYNFLPDAIHILICCLCSFHIDRNSGAERREKNNMEWWIFTDGLMTLNNSLSTLFDASYKAIFLE